MWVSIFFFLQILVHFYFAGNHVVPIPLLQVFLDNVKGRMCCLPVVVSAWICSYMNTVGEEARAKPLVMLQQLKNVVPPDPSNQYYNDRSVIGQAGVSSIEATLANAT